MLYLYLIIVVFSLYLIKIKQNRSIFYLPVILLLIEISRILFESMGIPSDGLNGLIFIVLLLNIVYNFKLNRNSRYITLLLIISIVSFFLAFRVDYSTAFFNSISRIGTFCLMLFIIPIAFINKREISRDELRRLLNKMLTLYFVFVIIASIFKFGPNHYGTNLIYGFKFEQWYLGALLIAIYPFFVIPSNKRILHYFLYLLYLIILLLVLRRTVWFIIIFSSLFSIFLLRRNILNKRYFSIIIRFFILVAFGAFITNYFNLWSIRGERSLKIQYLTEKDYEKEGRFLEVEYAIYTLEISNKLIMGSGYLFDDVGRYHFPNPNRPIHGTYTKIFFGGGLVGLFLYALILLISLKYLYSHKIKNDYLHAIVFSSFFTYIIVLSTGASGHNVGAPYVAALFMLVGYLMPHNKKHN